MASETVPIIQCNHKYFHHSIFKLLDLWETSSQFLNLEFNIFQLNTL